MHVKIKIESTAHPPFTVKKMSFYFPDGDYLKRPGEFFLCIAGGGGRGCISAKTRQLKSIVMEHGVCNLFVSVFNALLACLLLCGLEKETAPFSPATTVNAKDILFPSKFISPSFFLESPSIFSSVGPPTHHIHTPDIEANTYYSMTLPNHPTNPHQSPTPHHSLFLLAPSSSNNSSSSVDIVNNPHRHAKPSSLVQPCLAV